MNSKSIPAILNSLIILIISIVAFGIGINVYSRFLNYCTAVTNMNEWENYCNFSEPEPVDYTGCATGKTFW